MQDDNPQSQSTLEFFLGLANEISSPTRVGDDVFEDREFVCSNGWAVTFFYDGGDLDYIDHFTSPTGEKIDFWEWPDDSSDRQALIDWRGDHRTMPYYRWEGFHAYENDDGSAHVLVVSGDGGYIFVDRLADLPTAQWVAESLTKTMEAARAGR